MGTKTISLADDAYEALLGLKQPGESFSDAIRRLARRRSLTDLSGVLDPKAANAIARAIEATRADRLRKRKDELGL